MAETCDVAILGGGLAGLSLAVRLAAQPALRTIVVEPRNTYRRDRTWCSGRLRPHPFGAAVAESWPRWTVRAPGEGGGPDRVAVQFCPAIPYEMIPADRLYDAARSALAGAPNVALRTGIAAEAVTEDPGGVTVETSRGTLRAGLVFDGRPPRAGAAGSLVQRFGGQEVVMDRPVFDPGTATLMDFAVAQRPGAVRFLYVLPTSPTEALVEDTFFAPADMPLPPHGEAIRDYLGTRYGASVAAVRFEEAGAIPMDPGLQAPAEARRVIPIGTAGGFVKPSSGYAFSTIQRGADALAADLAAGRRPRPFQPRNAAARALDAVFLRALRRRPEDAPAIFHALFSRVPPPVLIRFLNDVGSPLDVARVVAATPKTPMLAAVAAGLRPGATIR